jgi:hypothetical protein
MLDSPALIKTDTLHIHTSSDGRDTPCTSVLLMADRNQCCGSGIGCLFDPWIRAPGSVMDKKSGSGCGMNNPNHISESLEIIFWLG